jgi:hypothetical protein
MDTYHKEKGSKGSSSWSFCASILKEEQKEDRRDSCSILPRRPLHRESGIAPISDDEPTDPERNLLNGNPADEGTDTEISDDITRPESGTRRNLYRETRSRRWEKLRRNVSSGKEGIPDDAIVGGLKNRPSRRQGNVGKFHSLGAT